MQNLSEAHQPISKGREVDTMTIDDFDRYLPGETEEVK